MGNRGSIRLASERLTQGLALVCLLAMGAWVLFGPSGLMAWSENSRMLGERQKELQQLGVQRNELKTASRCSIPITSIPIWPDNCSAPSSTWFIPMIW